MTEQEKLVRDIETMLESIRLAWLDIAKGAATRQENLPHIQRLYADLKPLWDRLGEFKNSNQ